MAQHSALLGLAAVGGQRGYMALYLLQALIIQLEGPELEPGCEVADGRQGKQKLLCRAQGHIRVGQLGLLDLLLLLPSRDHGQDFLEQVKRAMSDSRHVTPGLAVQASWHRGLLARENLEDLRGAELLSCLPQSLPY